MDHIPEVTSNVVTIATNPESGRYSYGGTSLTMTVREAQALQHFLNEYLVIDGDASL